VVTVEFLFDFISAPEITKVSVEEDASVTVAYSLIKFWQVEIINPGPMVLGIIGNKKPARSSYEDVTCFGWFTGVDVIVAGSCQVGLGSWDGWKAGDKLTFTSSPSTATLFLQVLRCTREVHRQLQPAGWSIHTKQLPEKSKSAILKGYVEAPGDRKRQRPVDGITACICVCMWDITGVKRVPILIGFHVTRVRFTT